MTETRTDIKLKQLRDAFKAKFGEDLSDQFLMTLVDEEIAKYKKKFVLEERLRYFSFEELVETKAKSLKTEPSKTVTPETNEVISSELKVGNEIIIKRKRGRPSKMDTNGELRL